MLSKRLILLGLLVIALVSPSSADVTDCSWVFSTPGNMLGWQANKYSSYAVSDGYFHGITAAYDSSLKGPSMGASCPASSNHYVQIKMRMRMATAPTDRYGASDAYVYFITSADPTFTSSKMVAFTTYGNGAWKTYNVRIGHLSTWTSNITRLKIYCTGMADAETDIEWIKVIRDTTPPSFSAEHLWTYDDGETTNDATPTVKLRECYDVVSGVERAEFYLRPGVSESEADWVLQGTDADPSDGLHYTYPQLPNGVYDLGAKVYDKSGNVGSWADGDDRWIDDLTIDSGLATRIDVDAGEALDAVPKEVFGNNIAWFDWSNKYNPSTGLLLQSLEDRIARMGITVLRYPGGCYSDTFYWKKSIGPVASRPDQYANGCNTTLTNRGPAKFGLNEFLRFCETRGIQPMFTCRFRWLGAPGAPGLDGPDPYAEALADAIDLVEYCNSPNDGSNPNGGTDWAAERAANGHPEPYDVKLFEIGNEPWGPDPWGSAGNIGLDGASEYSVAFLDYLEAMTAVDPAIKVSVTSSTQAQLDFDPASPPWTWSVYEQTGSYISHAQTHPYLPYSCWQTDVVKLYDETMAVSKAMDDVLCTQRATIRLTTPEKAGQIKLRLTEWDINYGWTYDPSQGRINLNHAKTLKPAISAADTFRIFMENRDLVESAEWWHLYNWVYACIAGDDVTVYPIYYVFRIFNRHFGDNLVNCKVIGSPTFDYVWASGSVLKSQYDLAYLTATASVSTDGMALYLVVVNKDRENPHTATLNLAGFLNVPGTQVEAEIWELNGPNVDDYVNVNNVKITESSAVYDPSFTYSFPAHSVTSFKFVQAPLSVADIGSLKTLPGGTRVQVADKVVTGIFPPDALYIEQDDRSSGIRVSTDDLSASEGNRATVVGRTGVNAHGERYIAAETIGHDSSAVALPPVAMVQRALVPPALDTTGLLVQVFGWTSGTSEDSFYVHDGSPIASITGQPGVKVFSSSPPGDGKLVIVTGIRSLQIPQGGTTAEPVVLTRRDSDVQVIM